jgi:ATP-binding cassette, subfamily B, bacterial
MRRVSFSARNRSDATSTADLAADELVVQAPAVARTEVLRRFWPWVRPDRWWLLTGILFLAAGSAGEVVSVWLFKDLIDEVLVPRHLAAFWAIGGQLLVVAALTALVTFLGNYTATWVAERFVLRLRTDCVEHLHTLPPDTLRTRWHGDVVARMTNDIESIEEFVASGLIEFASAVISLVFFTTAAFFLSWPLALAVCGTAPAFYLSARYFADRVQARSRESVRREGRIMGVVEESLANSALAHAYNQQRHEVARVRDEGRNLVRAELATARVAQLYPAFLEVLEVLGGLAVMGFGAFLLSQGSLTIGGLIAFAAFLTQLFSPASQLSALASSFGAAAAGAERIIELSHMRSPVQ